MEKVKSDLQKKLESEGWELLYNESKNMDHITRGGIEVFQPRFFPKTDQQIIKEHLERGFKEVRIEDAYNIGGEPINSKYTRAVYVKR